MSAYDSGVLVWVDDDFEHDELFGEGRDIDVWRRIFGDIDSQVYWLLNLRLEIATSADGAIALLEELTGRDSATCMVQGVLDMRIPARPGMLAEKKYGLTTASAFAERRVPFCILSSKTDAQMDLIQRGLEGINYYPKLPAPNSTMMPETLARRVLSEFRAGIFWIDLRPILRNWDDRTRYPNPLQGAGDAKYVFPFFGSCREFVERWEGRQSTFVRSRVPNIVLRSPEGHSDEFVLQCISLVTARRNQGRDVQVVFAHGAGAEAEAVLDAEGDNLLRVVRLSGDSDPTLEREMRILRHIVGRPDAGQVVSVLPQDDRADPFLSALAAEPDLVFDDLPAVSLRGFSERETLIRQLMRYLLQRHRLPGDGGETAYVSEFYCDHPETLFHPLCWTFLLEDETVSRELSDPYEMTVVLSEAIDAMADWPGAVRQKLIDGEALPLDYLLWPARNIFEAQTREHARWTEAAFGDWLGQSWRTPYGCIDMRREGLSSESLHAWERQCLLLCADLAERFIALPVEARARQPAQSQAAAFLRAPAIQGLIAGSTASLDWIGLESMRWPHAVCPMPAALNRRLKEEGRYLFVQTDVLHRATLTSNGTWALLRLEEYAEAQGARLDLLRVNVPNLPDGWKESATEILAFIESGATAAAGATSEETRRRIWPAILSLAKNATIVSFVYNALRRHGGELTADDLKLLLGGRASESSGEGKLLSVIREYRSTTLSGGGLPNAEAHRNTARDLAQLRALSAGLIAFTEHEPHDGLNQLTHCLAELVGAFGHVPSGFDDAMDMQALSEWLAPVEATLRKDLYAPRRALQTNAFFDRNFSMPAEVGGLPITHGTLRGTGLDLLLWLFEWSDLANWYLRTAQYSDGYHSLSLVRDQRNVGKDMIADVSPETLSTIMEMFLVGSRGLLYQLRHCLHVLGEEDLAAAFTGLGEMAPDGTPRAQSVADVFRVERESDGYALFCKGMPGKMRRSFAFVRADLSSAEPAQRRAS